MKKYWLEIVVVLLFVIKLCIVKEQVILVKGYGIDDGLFVEEATSIVEGNWLGEYNHKTLCKGITGVLFIALANWLGISYLMAEQLLYFLACYSMMTMLKHVTQKKGILLLCYGVLLFNPISYSDAFSFVYREGVYTALTLFLIAFSFQVFFHYKSKISRFVFYSITFGMSLAAIWLCREETATLLPYLIIAFGIIIGFILGDRTCQNKIKRMLILLGIPIGMVILYIIIISSINYKYYGRFISNDFTSRDFQDAYGALTRIKQENYIKRVPLNEESRDKLYKLSPKFQQLENHLEGEGAYRKDKSTRDYQEGFLYWAVREAAYELGYYENGKTAEQFYRELADEINTLCDSRTN